MTSQSLSSFFDVDAVDLAVDVDWESLPESLREIKNALGPQAAMAVSRAFGGANLYVPLTLHEDSQVVQRLGRPLATALCKRYGGSNLSVAKPDAVYRQLRLKAMRRRRLDGVSLTQLAYEFGLSRRRVMQLMTD